MEDCRSERIRVAASRWKMWFASQRTPAVKNWQLMDWRSDWRNTMSALGTALLLLSAAVTVAFQTGRPLAAGRMGRRAGGLGLCFPSYPQRRDLPGRRRVIPPMCRGGRRKTAIAIRPAAHAVPHGRLAVPMPATAKGTILPTPVSSVRCGSVSSVVPFIVAPRRGASVFGTLPSASLPCCVCSDPKGSDGVLARPTRWGSRPESNRPRSTRRPTRRRHWSPSSPTSGSRRRGTSRRPTRGAPGW